MTETRRERRRRNLLDEKWLLKYGDPANPKSRTRNWRKHMGLK